MQGAASHQCHGTPLRIWDLHAALPNEKGFSKVAVHLKKKKKKTSNTAYNLQKMLPRTCLIRSDYTRGFKRGEDGR
jgi:hypothetical protein